MKITDIQLFVLEDPDQPQGTFKLRRVPGVGRTQYSHGSKSAPTDRNLRQSFLRVRTDEGVDGLCTTTMTPEQVEILRVQVMGKDPLRREHLYSAAAQGHSLGLPEAGLVRRLRQLPVGYLGQSGRHARVRAHW